MAPTAPSRTRRASALSTWPPMRAYGKSSPYPERSLQAGEVFRASRDVLLGDRLHQVGHAGIVAARAVAEIEHRLQQVFLGLAGDPRLRPFAEVAGLVAAGAADCDICPYRPLGDLRRGTRLLQVGPALLREIQRQRHHVIALQRLRQRRHDVVLARAALVVAQLQIGVALVLTPDHRHRFLLRNAVLAMTPRANLRLLLDALRRRGGWNDRDDNRERRQQPRHLRFHVLYLTQPNQKDGTETVPSLQRMKVSAVQRHQSTVKAMMT